MGKKKKQQKKSGRVREITITPSSADVQSNRSDQIWFEYHPDYKARVRPYIPGEFEGIPDTEQAILETLEYVIVMRCGQAQRARIPYTGEELKNITLILPRSIKPDDIHTALSIARSLATHAEVMTSSDGTQRKIVALCTPEQQPVYEDFLQYVFLGAKRHQR